MSSPSEYTYRDLLLLSQLLHTRGLIQPEQVRAADLAPVAAEWFKHPGTEVSQRQGQFPLQSAPSAEDVLALYEEMLTSTGSANTTELANRYYFARVEQLEGTLGEQKARFRELLT